MTPTNVCPRGITKGGTGSLDSFINVCLLCGIERCDFLVVAAVLLIRMVGHKTARNSHRTDGAQSAPGLAFDKFIVDKETCVRSVQILLIYKQREWSPRGCFHLVPLGAVSSVNSGRSDMTDLDVEKARLEQRLMGWTAEGRLAVEKMRRDRGAAAGWRGADLCSRRGCRTEEKVLIRTKHDDCRRG